MMDATEAKKITAAVLFVATVPLANWMIGNVGECVPNGPCVVPVGFGLMAPSGVMIVGITLVLRDWLQELTSWRWSLLMIIIGAGLSWFVNPAVAAASMAAFAASEIADMAVYTPMRKLSRSAAVVVSGVVGATLDSFLFLYLAFGAVDYWQGNALGKLYASVVVAVVLMARRR